MIPCIPSFGSYRHRGRGKVLHLLQMEIESLGDNCQFGHVFFRTAWMATDEVRYYLLAEVLLLINSVEYLLELVELTERRFPHDVKHSVAGVLGSHFQASAHMIGNQFTGIFFGGFVDDRIVAFV